MMQSSLLLAHIELGYANFALVDAQLAMIREACVEVVFHLVAWLS